ncbi:hypothetical protein [Streptomyces sp. NPDC058869]
MPDRIDDASSTGTDGTSESRHLLEEVAALGVSGAGGSAPWCA